MFSINLGTFRLLLRNFETFFIPVAQGCRNETGPGETKCNSPSLRQVSPPVTENMIDNVEGTGYRPSYGYLVELAK
jgi:hypothetical protein